MVTNIFAKIPFAYFYESLKKNFVKEKQKIHVVNYSKFQEYISEMNKGDIMFQKASRAATLCEEALEIARNRFFLTSKINEYRRKMQDIECYANLANEDEEELKKLLEIYTSLYKERQILLHKLADFDKNIPKMNECEKEANIQLDQIKDVEKTHMILKQNLNFLIGEKAMLEEEEVSLLNNRDLLNKFNIIAIAFFTFATLILGYLYMLKNLSIFIPTTILILLCITTIGLFQYFGKRFRHLNKINILKQNRTTLLLNKKNTIYAYYTNFLQYEYAKFDVRNSQMLTSNIKEFQNYKHTISRIDTIRKLTFETEKELSKFLKDKKINYNFDIDSFAKTINITNKLGYANELLKKKNAFEKDLEALDTKHESMWNMLNDLNNRDVSSNRIISKLISLYFHEVDKIFKDKNQVAVDKVIETV